MGVVAGGGVGTKDGEVAGGKVLRGEGLVEEVWVVGAGAIGVSVEFLIYKYEYEYKYKWEMEQE